MDRPDAQKPRTLPTVPSDLDPNFKVQVQRLHQLTVYFRWLFVALLWVSLAPISLWGWRYEISLLREHFTWAALRYSIIFNPLPAFGFGVCVAMMAAILVWQSRNILLGIPQQEQQHLEQQVRRISQQGVSHPLWKWVFKRD
ncbi:MAG: hypothetical protein AB1589_14295 [Cyanobacteriota bacterium]